MKNICSASITQAIILSVTLFLGFTNISSGQEKLNLNGIQDEINNQIANAYVAKETKEIDNLISNLRNDKTALGQYWTAYTLYLKAIYLMGTKQIDLAEKANNEGVQILKKSIKSSEVFALLGSMQNLSISFGSMRSLNRIAQEAQSNLEKSKEMDPNNLRSYLGLGLQDYYTPVEFGGKQKVELFLLKAIELPSQSKKNPAMPSWGKKEAYHTLIQFYLESNKKDKAVELYKDAIKAYPNDYRILSLSKALL